MHEEELKNITEEQTQETVLDTTENLTDSKEETNNIEQATEQNKEQQLQQELNEFKDKYLRLFAEFDNFKKRNAKERRDLVLVAGQDLMKELLPIIDDFKRANKTYTQDTNAENYVNGIQLIQEKFLKILSNKGLKELESIGAEFNVEQHEAIAEIPVLSEEQKGRIIDEVECGYTLNGVIIRYAKVVVGK